MVLAADLGVSRGGRDLGLLSPSQNIYATLDQPVITPAVREEPWGIAAGLLTGRNPLPDLAQLFAGRNPFEDLYVVLEAVDTGNANTHRVDRPVTIQVLVNPLVSFIWLGGFVVGLGGFCALLPARRRRRVAVAVPETVRSQPEEAPV